MKDDNKYELILKRLLEQQNIKKIGPKRRETIRFEGGDDIKEMVKNLLKENKKDILSKKSETENNNILLKKQFQKKGRFSVTIDKNTLLTNNVNNKKKFQEQYLNNRNTICEVIAESNRQNSSESNS